MNDKHTQATIYFAGGCFWGTEHFFRQIRGVTDTEAGYANSKIPDPTYRQVCTGATGAAETVKVDFAPSIVPPADLIALYFLTIDPTSVNRQGNDSGTQYRTGIYYTDSALLSEINSAVSREQMLHSRRIAVEVAPLENFYPAEDYHQDYLNKTPGGYCHINPDLFRIAASYKSRPKTFTLPDDSTLRRTLSPTQYAVTRQNATEAPYTNEYYLEDRPGIYVDITNGEPLFLSTDKFHSSCGWPSFSRPISSGLINYLSDHSHGMRRTEVRSMNSDSHLGHVFPDGPEELGGHRFCINSAALRFIPVENMEKEGFGELIPLLNMKRTRNH